MDAEEAAVSKNSLDKDATSAGATPGDLKNKKGDGAESKPRIVLTFRSEKSGAKSNNMKIVTSEEKREEISPRRSARTRTPRYESDEDFEVSLSPRKHQVVSDNDTSCDSHTTKRSTRCKSKEGEGSSKKDNPSGETPVQTRLSRRIKPTAKVLANEELRIGLESQNNARLGVQKEKSPEAPEGGRRPRRERSYKGHYALEVPPLPAKGKPQKKKKKEETKLSHLGNLGLKAVETKEDDSDCKLEESSSKEVLEPIEIDDDLDDEEIDDDTEVISKLLEDDSCDEDFVCSDNSQQEPTVKRRTTRQRSMYAHDSDEGHVEDEHSAPQRRSTRIRKGTNFIGDEDWELERALKEHVPAKKSRTSAPPEPSSEVEDDEKISDPASAEGTEATAPLEDYPVVATCTCEQPSNVYADPDELDEPVFCQAIELVEGVRVGCSHLARRSADNSLEALVRAGPRSPYFLACSLHAAQLSEHMCCPACGVFCTQGTFYQCPLGHLFHIDCGLPYNEAKSKGGCPHCGVVGYVWRPITQDCHTVKVTMNCQNKKIYLPDQRQHCTPAYLGFSKGEKPKDEGPVIPKELLPSPPINLKDIKRDCQTLDGNVEDICQAIFDKENIELLIPKIMSVPTSDLFTCVHAAARTGHLAATYLLQFAGADIDAKDANGRTPLMLAILALLEKEDQSSKILKKVITQKSVKKIVKQELAEVEVKEDVESEEKQKTDDEKKLDVTSEETEVIDTEEKLQTNEECDEKSEEKVDFKCEETKQNDTDISEEIKEENEVVEKEELVKKDCDETEMEVDEEIEVNKPSDEDLMKVIRYLVAAGCDVNIHGPEEMTALHMAAQYGGVEVCKVLLSNVTVDVDARDHGGWTPLVWAAENCHEEVVRLLVEKGADSSVADKEGNTAVHWCALSGHSTILQLLLEASPSAIHLCNDHHDTPLHIAAQQGHYACVVVLLARGARTDLENSSGELPVELASEQCQAAIALSMQMSVLVNDQLTRRKLLSSDISRGRETYPIPCVNDIDEEPLPEFTYVTSHVMPQHLAIDYTSKTLQGCECTGNCSQLSCSCVSLSVRRWASGGRLTAGFPYHDPPMMFLCNQLCGCDLKKCSNTFLTDQLKLGSVFVRTMVRRLPGPLGWGLFTCEKVLKGTPVALYVGELIPAEEADTRSNDHYMFALDINQDLLEQCIDKTQLCIDAHAFGGAARLINHSCAGALSAVRVFGNTRDLRLPHVVLVATRDLDKGEQLTFDYGDKFWAVKSKWMKCECGEASCRYPTIVTEDADGTMN